MMADRSPDDAGPGEGGIFGKLPSARPGVRSSRRRAPDAADPEPRDDEERQVGQRDSSSARATGPGSDTVSPGAGSTDAERRASASPSPTTPGAAEPEAGEPPGAPEGEEGPRVEDLAWAGITVAAEAATLGVRLLNRAVGAVRRPTDRR
jgi:hypothetical protein